MQTSFLNAVIVLQRVLLEGEQRLGIMRIQEEENTDFLNQNEFAREYVQGIQILLNSNDSAEELRKISESIEATWQQLNLGLKNANYVGTFPDITNETFWSHLYRRACADPENKNSRMVFNIFVVSYFEAFDDTRKFPGTSDYIYNRGTLDIVHREISYTYGDSIIQNVAMRLLSFKTWIIRLFKGFLINHQTRNNVQVAVITIAKDADEKKIVKRSRFARLPSEGDIPGLRHLYGRIEGFFHLS